MVRPISPAFARSLAGSGRGRQIGSSASAEDGHGSPDFARFRQILSRFWTKIDKLVFSASADDGHGSTDFARLRQILAVSGQRSTNWFLSFS